MVTPIGSCRHYNVCRPYVMQQLQGKWDKQRHVNCIFFWMQLYYYLLPHVHGSSCCVTDLGPDTHTAFTRLQALMTVKQKMDMDDRRRLTALCLVSHAPMGKQPDPLFSATRHGVPPFEVLLSWIPGPLSVTWEELLFCNSRLRSDGTEQSLWWLSCPLLGSWMAPNQWSSTESLFFRHNRGDNQG